MSSRRVLKAAEAIREVVSTAILLELRDPRVQDVTVTRVEVSGDMRNAKVYVSVMGDESKEKLSLHGLRNAAGFLQQRIGQRIDTRYTPRLAFDIDRGVKSSLQVAAVLTQLQKERELRERELLDPAENAESSENADSGGNGMADGADGADGTDGTAGADGAAATQEE
jgi:ribosome-binding factor A